MWDHGTRGEAPQHPPALDLAVVLAAGASSRMGQCKALLPVRGVPVIAWHCATLRAIAREVLVVVGARGDEVAAAVPGARIVWNRGWEDTAPADSLRLALAAAGDVVPDGLRALVTPVDVLPARPATLQALVDAGGAAIPVGPDGRDGHPVLLDAALIRTIRRAAPPGGLRTLLGDVVRVPVADAAVAIDFDDPAAFAEAVVRWPSQIP